ncbi:hypothetical protein ERD78_18910 [Allopusillimonas soli]|uniref:Lipoprotein n=1 Tax=Allopusillimonas soli TaxID=659016 RepID=A0A853FJE7_9BURK|nr:hypothetical protein [Allopusillimonas soli]NYT38860.1 hypothetical protein [Allopusillimonas soli]TEA70140.1 hypothetical protein ERD78_18910 [Allopusillimonas soli]
MRALVIVAALVLLGGCAPATLDGVRNLGPESAYTFTAPENYQAVYRTVLKQSRKCHESGLITAQIVVHGDLYQDIKAGTVSVELHGGLGVDVYQVIDIKAVDDDSSRVLAHYSVGSPSQKGDLLKRWVLDGEAACK